MHIAGAGMTHVGNVRASNEDNLYLDGWYPDRMETDSNCSQDHGGRCFHIIRSDTTGQGTGRDWHAFAVSDGMGGERYGEVASRIAVETLAESDGPGLSFRMDEFIQKANDRVLQEMSLRAVSRMGAAVAVLAITEGGAAVCNLGDCRIYRFDGTDLEQLSVDHRTNSPAIYAGTLTQHLGVPRDEFILEPHIVTGIPVKAGDIYLLCSDGLTDMLSDERIGQILESMADDAPERIAADLIGAALDRGGKDNVTVIIVKIS